MIFFCIIVFCATGSRLYVIFTGIWHFLFINDYSRQLAINLECVAEGRNPVGESPTSCALVLFEKPNLMHHREVMCEGDAVFERTVGEISGRNRSEN